MRCNTIRLSFIYFFRQLFILNTIPLLKSLNGLFATAPIRRIHSLCRVLPLLLTTYLGPCTPLLLLAVSNRRSILCCQVLTSPQVLRSSLSCSATFVWGLPAAVVTLPLSLSLCYLSCRPSTTKMLTPPLVQRESLACQPTSLLTKVLKE